MPIMDPREHKHHIFGDQFYRKNAQKLKFYAAIHFHASKYKIS